jgi:hypothetical protein
MTVSTTDIPVLHSVEVAHLYPQVVLPICHGLIGPHTLRDLYKVPLASEPATVLGSSNAGIPRLTAIAAKSTLEPPYTDHYPTALAPFG